MIEEVLRRRVDSTAADLVSLSQRLHAHPETAWQEHRASAWVSEMLQDNGFSVTARTAGLETAFVARMGDGPLHLALCAEYDALPGLGHACGHNVIAASSVGAGLALGFLADDLGLTVSVIGCPAEESGGGKVRLLEAGVFDGVHAAGLAHPGPFDEAAPLTTAMGSFEVEYLGVAAHAGAAPERGVNALDAMTVAQVAVGLLRQQLPGDAQVHGIVTAGGDAPSIIPARVAGRFMARTPTLAELDALRARVDACFRAGALATGADLRLADEFPRYAEMRHHPGLVRMWTEVALGLGRAPQAAEPGSRTGPTTDMGNISHAIPALHPMIGLGSGDVRPHHPDFAAAAASRGADAAVRDAALALSLTFARLAQLPDPVGFLAAG